MAAPGITTRQARYRQRQRSIINNKARWWQTYIDARESAEYNIEHHRWAQAGQSLKKAGAALVQYQQWIDRDTEAQP